LVVATVQNTKATRWALENINESAEPVQGAVPLYNEGGINGPGHATATELCNLGFTKANNN